MEFPETHDRNLNPGAASHSQAEFGVKNDANHSHLQRGVAHFNAGQFYEAHHEWETDWTKLEPRSKLYVQALIQVCAVGCHLQKKRSGPARALCHLALEKFESGIPEEYLPRVEIPKAKFFLCKLSKAFEDASRWASDVPPTSELLDSELWLSKLGELRAIFREK